MSTPRIDSLRNQIAGTVELLEMVHEELEDLYVLAYDRPSAVDEAKVAGGSANYYLDTHGDQRARQAYQQLARTLDGVCITLDGASYNALNLLREGPTPIRQGSRTTQLVELGEAIAARARRQQRGEYVPVRRGPQPEEAKALSEVIRQRDQLRRDLEDVTRDRDRLRRERAS